MLDDRNRKNRKNKTLTMCFETYSELKMTRVHQRRFAT